MILWQNVLAFCYLTGKEMPVDDNVRIRFEGVQA